MEKRNTRIKIKKKGKGRRAKLVRVSEIMKNARPGTVALPGVTKSRALPSIVTKGAGKAKGVELREARYDLLNELDEYLYPSPEDDSDEAKKKTRKRRESAPGRTFDAVMRVRQIPSLTMAVLESIYAQEVPVGERRPFTRWPGSWIS